VTPTGAAILRYLVKPDASASVAGRLAASGTGTGTRTLPGIPNVLRALVFERTGEVGRERVVVICFEVDDMTGEEIAVAADRLRAVDGVLDLVVAQAQGKKGRLMQSFRLLVQPGWEQAVVARCFLETSTIGLRIHEEDRVVLPRHLGQVAAEGAAVRIKTVERAGTITAKAESDDLAGETLEARRILKRLAEGSA
jgi:uncharacterized protein (DUF111 family)